MNKVVKFEKALEAMREGKKVRKTDSDAEYWLGEDSSGQPCFFTSYPINNFHPYEILEEDWNILEND